MTDEGLWLEVGRALRNARIRQGFESTNALKKAKKRGAPAVHTMDAIEEGLIGNVASVSLYCQALKLDLWRILVAILRGALKQQRALTADGFAVGRSYERGRNVFLTKAMWDLAQSLDAQSAAGHGSSPTPPDETKPIVRRTPSGRGRAEKQSMRGASDDERP